MYNNIKIPIALIVIISVIIVAILLFEKIQSQREEFLKNQYDEISAKSIDDVTEQEWATKNEYEVLLAKKNGWPIDTQSYIDALTTFMEINSKRYNYTSNNCSQEKLVEAFHSIMKFNMPYEKYNPESINIQNNEDCTLNINVTTTEPKYGWDTFWVFRIAYNQEINKYVLETINRRFLGD